MKRTGLLFLFILMGQGFGLSQPQAQTFQLEFMGGSAINFLTPLTLRQNGYPDLQFSANYDTNPFGGHAPYYAWRISLWNGAEGWEFEHLHHKLYLANPPAEITAFAISHGYNYFLFGHVWKRQGFNFHLDLGPIMTHPEAVVRGQTMDEEHGGLLNEGYYISGIGFHTAVGRQFYLNPNFFAVLEAAFTVGWAWEVPMPGGSADVPNAALHGHMGMGYDF